VEFKKNMSKIYTNRLNRAKGLKIFNNSKISMHPISLKTENKFMAQSLFVINRFTHTRKID